MTSRSIPCFVLGLTLLASCSRRGDSDNQLPLDTVKPAAGLPGPSRNDTTKTDTTQTARADSNKSNLPPMAKAIEPDRLAQYLPKPAGWTPSGETQKEIQIHQDFNKSRVAQTYTNGSKKLTIEINDYAYVPYLYEPWAKFKGSYLDEDNVARTETTQIDGYNAVQEQEKKDPHGVITVFPGKRYVVIATEDGDGESINELRQIVSSMDLHGLEQLQ